MKETDFFKQLRFPKADLAGVGEQLRQVLASRTAEERLFTDIASRRLLEGRVSGFRGFDELLRPEYRNLEVQMQRFSEAYASSGRQMQRMLAGIRIAADAQVSPDFGRKVDLALAGIRNLAEEAGASFALEINRHRELWENSLKLEQQNWARDFGALTSRIADVARVNFAIPEIAFTHWSGKLIADRTFLLQDCIRNTAALEALHGAAILTPMTLSADGLAVAGRLVLDHAEVVRRLPPSLPILKGSEHVTDSQSHRDEEIGARLEIELGNFDARLLELRRHAWRSLASGGAAAARIAMTGIREVFTDVLHALAPDNEVKAATVWQTRSNQDVLRPTRRMRLEYVLGEEDATNADALLQFNDAINRSQKFVHTFADDPELVRVQMAQLENWLYLLLTFAKRRSR